MPGFNEVRQDFIAYFVKHGHTHVPSSSLVPQNDPSLLFTNSGMVQFKNFFTGTEKPPYPSAVTAQKCLRAGGKHNDLDNVGYTARHHTFFEMLGNFSFGSYFKPRAVELAWGLVTGEWGVPASRLWATVYQDDDETYELWRRVANLPESRIVRIATSENYWSMGDTGPCGPCSELFFDHGDSVPGGPPGSADSQGDRFTEIWNLVFMQDDMRADGSKVQLPTPGVDTGMGLERIATLLQGGHDNFQSDFFQTLIDAIATCTGVVPSDDNTASFRVIADHIRAIASLIADGVYPSNTGRGYVVRRILRRAVRHAHLLGSSEPVLHRIVGPLIESMGATFPELERHHALIADTVHTEEKAFLRTLQRGLVVLESETRHFVAGATLPAGTLFRLYDTFGFPADLTRDALRARGIAVDWKGFEALMADHKASARASWSGAGESGPGRAFFGLSDSVGPSEFLGYTCTRAQGIVQALAYVEDDGSYTTHDSVDASFVVDSGTACMILNQTPFYPESGGQIGDSGRFSSRRGQGRIRTARRVAESMIVHAFDLESGSVSVGDTVDLTVDAAARGNTCRNHSATHILHAGLRSILGTHVTQRGSRVDPNRLRFDFSHSKAVTPGERDAVQDLCNTIPLANLPVTTRVMGRDEAIASGATALFGEKYADTVRVVSIGVPEDPLPAFSVELCGGTHVESTGSIGIITLVSESAIAAGIRRIEALTGETARQYLEERARAAGQSARLLNVKPTELVATVTQMRGQLRTQERALANQSRRGALNLGSGPDSPVRSVNGTAFFCQTFSNKSPRELKMLADEAKRALGTGIAALATRSAEGKASVLVAVTDDLVDTFDAVALVTAAAPALGGSRGGGRAQLAQTGGPDGDAIPQALDRIRAEIQKKTRRAG